MANHRPFAFRRIFLPTTALVLAALACSLEKTRDPIPPGPPPTMPAVLSTNIAVQSPGTQTLILQDDLSNSTGVWLVVGQLPSEAELSANSGSILAEFNIAASASAAVIRHLIDLPSPANGVTLTIQAHDRPLNLLIGVNEADKSWYHTFLRLDPDSGARTYTIDYSWLRLNQDSQDENDFLDIDQVSELIIVDISGFIGPLGLGKLEIHGLAFWQGNALAQTQCVSDHSAAGDFLVGVDANFIPDGEDKGENWFVGDTPVDPLALLAEQGAEVLRLRIWVGDEGVSKLDYATDLARRAHENGLQVHPVLFLSPDWADVGKQPVPPEWQDLSLEDRADAIRDYSFETVQRLLEAGIRVPYYAVGNEIDFGISGVYAELEQRDRHTLETSIWPQSAILIKASIEGVRQADPNAQILLQLSISFDPAFALAFYQNMRLLGVEYDIAGLSFYPSAFGPLVVPGFCETIDRLGNEMGLPVVIPEFGYPAEIPAGGPFVNWYNDLPGYPLTQEGQARWIADFLASLRQHPNVIAAFYFSPAFHWGGDIWGAFALFDQDGRARLGVGALTSP